MHMHSSVLIPSIQIFLPNEYPKQITTGTFSEMQALQIAKTILFLFKTLLNKV